MDIRLSICISTYNREEFLRNAIEHVYDMGLDFPIEVVVMDNGSTDGTATVADDYKDKPNFRYFRQSVNCGPERNHLAALRVATGKYCLILADDDYLIADALTEAVAYMDSNEALVCVLTPWELWNDVEKKRERDFFSIQKEEVFQRGEFARFLDYILRHHIYPEVAMYRTSELVKCTVRTYKTFYSYPLMGRLLSRGGIAMLPRPYYRYVSKSNIVDTRPKEGVRLSMDEWDLYRGGLEYLLDKAVPAGTGFPEQRQAGLQLINQYMGSRISVGVRLLFSSKRYMEAAEALARTHALGYQDEITKSVERRIRPYAGIQSIHSNVQDTPTLSTIIFCDISLPDVIKYIIDDLGIGDTTKILTQDQAADVESKDENIVICGNSVDMDKMEAMGFPRYQLMTESDFLNIY